MTMGQITEETECTPITFLWKSKLAAERYLCEQRSDTFKVAVIRPPMILWESLYWKLCFIGEAGGQDTCFSRE